MRRNWGKLRKEYEIQRMRERVIKIAPVAEVSVNKYDARAERVEASAQAGSSGKRLRSETSLVKVESEGKEKIKPEKIVKMKKEKSETDDDFDKSKCKDRKTKSSKSAEVVRHVDN